MSAQKENSPFKESQQKFYKQPENLIEDLLSEEEVKSGNDKQSPLKLTVTGTGDSAEKIKGFENPSLNSSNVQFCSLSSQSLMTSNNGCVSADTSTNDPFRALCRMKEEFIFVFSGFNDQKLFTCECLDVQRGVWKEVC